MLNFNYKLFSRKHFLDITLSNVPGIDESGLTVDEHMLGMTPMSEFVKSNILKALIHEVKVLQEVMSHLVRKKGVCEGLINMLSPQAVVASSSQAVILDV